MARARTERSRARLAGGVPPWQSPTGRELIWLVGGQGVTACAQPALLDGDMEQATTTPPWTVSPDCAPTKETSDPYADLRNLRLTYTTATLGGVIQDVMTAYNRYLYESVYRCSAANCTGMRTYQGSVITDFPVVTTWSPAEAEATTDSARFRLSGFFSAGGYVEFDSVTLTNLSLNAWANQGALTFSMSNASAARQPWQSTVNSIASIRGDDDSLATAAAKSNFRFLHEGGGCTIAGLIRPTSLAATSRWFGNATATVTDIGLSNLTVSTGGAITIGVVNGASTVFSATSAVSAVSANVNTAFVCRHSTTLGYELWTAKVVGSHTLHASGAYAAAPAVSTDATYALTAMSHTNGASDYAVGHMTELLAHNKLLNPHAVLDYLLTRAA